MTIKDFANQHRLKLQRYPSDETDIIPGREGSSHIFEYGADLLAAMVLPYTNPDQATAHRWRTALLAFRAAGMVIRQDGDCEGTATFDPANPAQVKLAIKYAKVRPKRQISDAQRERLRSLGNLRRKAMGIAVEGDLMTQDRRIVKKLGMA
jgi:hypothetical protein